MKPYRMADHLTPELFGFMRSPFLIALKARRDGHQEIVTEWWPPQVIYPWPEDSVLTPQRNGRS